MPYHQIIYSSKISEGYYIRDVFEILKTARSKNAELGLSGFLIFGNNCFLQVLEGYGAPLKALYSKISKDKRHFDLKVLYEGDVENLSFEKWHMGFADTIQESDDALGEALCDIGQYGDFNPHVMSGKTAFKILSLFAERYT